ncbi:arginine deiminase-related protein [Brumimicrobium mesophilum]|uniref:arginine deiminase-related protein n=1 Tax=Brumimicrobium mesophilum TaxID=392717 RepID=UPI000D13FDCC|nr:arginine deiminase-related protein [Brumimicrobium mesophilum]
MQSSNNIFLVKPASFGYSVQTAASNAFQNQMSKDMDHEAISIKAIEEFETMVQKLTEKGVNVLVIEDTTTPVKPDAISPNNWAHFTLMEGSFYILCLLKTEEMKGEKKYLKLLVENLKSYRSHARGSIDKSF